MKAAAAARVSVRVLSNMARHPFWSESVFVDLNGADIRGVGAVVLFRREQVWQVAGMKLRLATIDDLALLRSWDEKAHVVAATGTDVGFNWAFELTRAMPWWELLIAEVSSRPIGVMQIIDPAAEETHYWGEIAPNLRAIDIWIGEEEDLGRGFGAEMMRLALRRCFAESTVTGVLVDPLVSNAAAHRFYERLGFECTERRVFGEDDCFVYRLDRERWESGVPNAAPGSR